MTCDRDWCWYIEELGSHRITENCAQHHEAQGRTVTIIQAGESDE